jgi:hypothetical protein
MLSSASRRTDRAAAATGALLLQLAFIAAFLHAYSQAPPARRELAHEITFFLPRLNKPEPVPSNRALRAAVPALIPPVFTLPPIIAVPLSETPSPQALQNFGQALQGCAPESYASLTPDQKARCVRPGEGVAVQQAPGMMGSPSHVKDEAHWANALAHEQSPVLLPGCSKDGKMCTIIGIDTDGKVTGLANASADPETWPTYDVTTYAAGDFYKVEQAYDAWHKDHPTTKASNEAAGSHAQ